MLDVFSKYIRLASLTLLLSFTCSTESSVPTINQKSDDTSQQTDLCEMVSKSIVKIENETAWGSGFIVAQHGSRYSVITNGHVLQDDRERFILSTSDGQLHEATLMVRFDHGDSTGVDLAILQFDSPKSHRKLELAQWNSSSYAMSVGYPIITEDTDNPESGSENHLDQTESFNSTNLFFDDTGILCTKLVGSLTILPQSMQGGYQLGAEIGVHAGMSGGPLVNAHGQVIAVNGKTQPLFLNPEVYLYRDGQHVSNSLIENSDATTYHFSNSDQALNFLSARSWFIPSQTVIYYAPAGLALGFSNEENLNNETSQ